jgi:hypothetical protein
MNSDFWDILHDGFIEAISGHVPGDVVLTIGIEYLCEQLPTAGATIKATLLGCRLLEYTPFDESTVTDIQRIAEHEVEVLSATAEADRITVHCANGSLDVAYDAVKVRTIEGNSVSQTELEAAANRSVAQWLEQNRGGQVAG